MTFDPNEARDQGGRWSSTSSGINLKKTSLEAFDALTKQNFKAPLATDEIAALGKYRNGSWFVNDRLRGTPGHSPKDLISADADIANLDSAFRKASLKDPIDVYRAIEKPFQQFMSGHDEFIDKGFLSTSLRPDVVRHFNSELTSGERKGYSTIKIAVPRGFPAIFLGPTATGWPLEHQNDYEWSDRETVLNRGTRLKRIGELIWKASE